MLSKRAIVAALLIAFSSPVFAAVKDDLAQTKQDIEQSRARQVELANQKKQIESELGSLQKKLVSQALEVQKGEHDLSVSEDKLRILKEQLKIKNDALDLREKNLAALTRMALRLSQTPPDAMVLMPGDTAKTIKAARAVKMAAAGIRDEADDIRLQVKELKALQDKIGKRRDEMMKQKTDLDEDRKSLQTRLTERRKLQNQLGHEEEDEAEKAGQLAKKAEDLQDLVTQLERSSNRPKWREHEVAPDNTKAIDKPEKGKGRSFAHAKGRISAPVAGKLVQSFGDAGEHGDTGKGLVIVARDGAQVVAPYDGEVVFSGPFLAYGKLVIIRHSDDFHTLLAGLVKIDVRVGDFLLEGEPIGAMGSKDSENRLYVELRKNNQPVDPAPWISGLKK